MARIDSASSTPLSSQEEVSKEWKLEDIAALFHPPEVPEAIGSLEGHHLVTYSTSSGRLSDSDRATLQRLNYSEEDFLSFLREVPEEIVAQCPVADLIALGFYLSQGLEEEYRAAILQFLKTIPPLQLVDAIYDVVPMLVERCCDTMPALLQRMGELENRDPNRTDQGLTKEDLIEVLKKVPGQDAERLLPYVQQLIDQKLNRVQLDKLHLAFLQTDSKSLLKSVIAMAQEGKIDWVHWMLKNKLTKNVSKEELQVFFDQLDRIPIQDPAKKQDYIESMLFFIDSAPDAEVGFYMGSIKQLVEFAGDNTIDFINKLALLDESGITKKDVLFLMHEMRQRLEEFIPYLDQLIGQNPSLQVIGKIKSQMDFLSDTDLILSSLDATAENGQINWNRWAAKSAYEIKELCRMKEYPFDIRHYFSEEDLAKVRNQQFEKLFLKFFQSLTVEERLHFKCHLKVDGSLKLAVQMYSIHEMDPELKASYTNALLSYFTTLSNDRPSDLLTAQIYLPLLGQRCCGKMIELFKAMEYSSNKALRETIMNILSSTEPEDAETVVPYLLQLIEQNPSKEVLSNIQDLVKGLKAMAMHEDLDLSGIALLFTQLAKKNNGVLDWSQLSLRDMGDLHTICSILVECRDAGVDLSVVDPLLSLPSDEVNLYLKNCRIWAINGCKHSEILLLNLPENSEISRKDLFKLFFAINPNHVDKLAPYIAQLASQNLTREELEPIQKLFLSWGSSNPEALLTAITNMEKFCQGPIDWKLYGSSLHDFYYFLKGYPGPDACIETIRPLVTNPAALKEFCLVYRRCEGEGEEFLKEALHFIQSITDPHIRQIVAADIQFFPHFKLVNPDFSQLLEIFELLKSTGKENADRLVLSLLLAPSGLLPFIKEQIPNINPKQLLDTLFNEEQKKRFYDHLKYLDTVADHPLVGFYLLQIEDLALRENIVHAAESFMQILRLIWIGSVEQHRTNDSKEGYVANWFMMHFKYDALLPEELSPVIREGIEAALKDHLNPECQIRMCCWEYVFLALVKAGVITKEQVQMIFFSINQTKDATLVRALLGDAPLSSYPTTEQQAPKRGDLLVYAEKATGKRAHASIAVSGDRAIELGSTGKGDVKYRDFESAGDPSKYSIHIIPAERIAHNVDWFIRKNPPLNPPQITKEKLKAELLETPLGKKHIKRSSLFS